MTRVGQAIPDNCLAVLTGNQNHGISGAKRLILSSDRFPNAPLFPCISYAAQLHRRTVKGALGRNVMYHRQDCFLPIILDIGLQYMLRCRKYSTIGEYRIAVLADGHLNVTPVGSARFKAFGCPHVIPGFRICRDELFPVRYCIGIPCT